VLTTERRRLELLIPVSEKLTFIVLSHFSGTTFFA
jgi:hypothetical protein